MAVNVEKFQQILAELGDKARLIAVSKTKPVEDIQALYDLGQRDFGENYVQELVDKQGQLPSDIRWHFIGHLQSNKVKYIAPFVHLIHGVDSFRLLKEIDKQAARNKRTLSCLLQVYIAREETKFGLDEAELAEVIKTIANGPASSGSPSAGAGELTNVNVLGLMGMASFTEDPEKIKAEFHTLKLLFDRYFGGAATSTARAASSTSDLTVGAPTAAAPILSMGMSGDYQLAIEEGSNMVRIGSLLFGKRG